MVTTSAPASRRRSRISTRSASSVVRSSMAVRMRSPSGMARSGRSASRLAASACSWLTRLWHTRDADECPRSTRGREAARARPGAARPCIVSAHDSTHQRQRHQRSAPSADAAAIRVGIIGAAGYVGGELIRLLERHPNVRIAGLQGRDRDHEPVTVSHPQLAGSDLHIEADLPDVDAVFLALPHGASARARAGARRAGAAASSTWGPTTASATRPTTSAGTASSIPRPELLAQAVYGLPEQHRAELLALAGRRGRHRRRAGLLPHDVAAGPLPAGPRRAHRRSSSWTPRAASRAPAAAAKADLLFTEVNESVKAYGLAGHRHISELEQELQAAGAGARGQPRRSDGRLHPPPRAHAARHPGRLPRAPHAADQRRGAARPLRRRPTRASPSCASWTSPRRRPTCAAATSPTCTPTSSSGPGASSSSRSSTTSSRAPPARPCRPSTSSTACRRSAGLEQLPLVP